MPPKGKAAASQKDIQDTEDPLQAVVLSDSFEDRFVPFCGPGLTPRTLLPLCNQKLLDYTLSWLESVGVDEVYLYLAQNDQVEDYIGKSAWTSDACSFSLQIIRSTSQSIGDAMRDLDKRAILKNDFLVVYGDVVCNMPIDRLLQEHRARRAADKNAIMTMVLREAGVRHRTKATETMPTFAVYPAKNRCLEYAQLAPGEGIDLDPDTLAYGDVELRTDLIDCGIDICTPEVLALWSDNFDYEAPRKGFLHSVLKDYELNGKTIHTYITSDYYAARVRNLAAYDAVSKDVVSRQCFPFCPDGNLGGDTTYTRSKNNVYREDGVKISRSSLVGPNVVIGTGSTVGTGSVVRDSTIGRNTTIAKGCTIEGAYIWDDVVVGEGSEICHAIVASGTTAGKNSKITDGALVGSGLALPDNFNLEQGRRVTGKRKRQDATQRQTDLETVSPDKDDHVALNTGLISSVSRLRVSPSQESISTLEDDSDFEDGEPLRQTMSAGSDESRHSTSGEAFVVEAANSIFDGLKQGHEASTIQLELQGLRMSSNASEHQVRRALVGGLIKHIVDASKQGKQAKTILDDAKALIERTVFDASSDDKADQLDFLLIAQADAAKREGGETLFVSFCNGLYLAEFDDEGIFETEAFERWWEAAASTASADLKRVHDKMQAFMDVIADDDDDDDDEDESDEDSD